MVPLFDLREQHEALGEELNAAFQRVFTSGRYILGGEVEAFEQSMADYLGVRHAIGVSSGTDALLLALMALDIGPGDEVLCPAFTFFATAGSVARLGATPVWVDVCPVCYNIDVQAAEAKVRPQTKAIMPVHLFGQAADMDSVQTLADRYNLAVVEDAAQAVGAKYRGKAVGGIGDFGALSFFPTKNLGAFGDAGMLLTNEDVLVVKARQLRVHGMEPKYFHAMVGGNFRIDSLQAALLAAKLPHLDTYTAKRRENADYYTDTLRQHPRIAVAKPEDCCCPIAQPSHPVEGEAAIILPVAYPHNEHVWNQYTIRVRGKGQRQALRDFLADRKVGAEIYYPLSLDKQACFKDTSKGNFGLDTSHILADEVLSIPIFPELGEARRTEVAEAILAFLG